MFVYSHDGGREKYYFGDGQIKVRSKHMVYAFKICENGKLSIFRA